MIGNLIEAGGAAYLIWIGVIMKANDGFCSSFVFKVVPVLFGVFMAFTVYAKFMGWPT